MTIPDRTPSLYVPRMDAILSRWFTTYQEARASLAEAHPGTGGRLAAFSAALLHDIDGRPGQAMERQVGDLAGNVPEGDVHRADRPGGRDAVPLPEILPDRPDVERIRRALDTLVVAIANAPTTKRAGALCAASWLSWALGRGSGAPPARRGFSTKAETRWPRR